MASFHARSNSLPTSSHPLTQTVESNLDRIRSSRNASSSLSILKDLYESVDDFLQLQNTSEDLQGSVEKVLDGSLRVLDVCSITRDIFSQMRESLKELESSLRRRKIGESELKSALEAYLTSKKRLNKSASKCVKNLNKNGSKDTNVLREVKQVTLTVFESLLSSVCETKSRSIVSKLLQSKSGVETEAKKIEAELISLKSSKVIDVQQVQDVLKSLQALESNVKEAEEELECVYRQLVKTQVSILNMINN